MVLVRLGALRFHGLIADFGSLPIDATLIGGIFDATDTVQKFVFDGSAWVEFVSGTGEANLGANVGVGTGLVFRDKIGVTLNFKSLIGGTNVTITDNSDDITISSTGIGPLTTKGDLFGFTTVDARFPVGVDGQVIQADSSQALGLKYVDLVFTKGQLLTFDTGLTQIGVGTNDQVLTADSAIASGLKWATPASGGGITGLNPDSTILDYLNSVPDVFTDYTTPDSATVTSSTTTGLNITDDYTNASLWVQTGSTVTVDGTTAGKMSAVAPVSNGTDRVTRDLGFTYSTDFTLEWTANVSAVPTTVGCYMMGYVSDDTVAASGTDGVLPLVVATGDFGVQLQHISNGTVAGGTTIVLGTGLLNTDLFYRVTRVGNLFTMQIFSDSARTILVGSPTSTSFTTAITDFRFLYHGARGPGGNTQTASWTVDDLSLFLDDILDDGANAIDKDTASFWQSEAGINEGITLDMASNVNMYGLAYFLSTDAGMTETQFQIISQTDNPTFFDNFSSYQTQSQADTSWIVGSAGNQVDITNNVLDIMPTVGVATNNTSHDLTLDTITVSDTQWVLRFKLRFSSLTSAAQAAFFLVMSSLPAGNLGTVARDFMGIQLSNNGVSNDYGFQAKDNLSLGGLGSQNATLVTWVIDTDYFFEIVRTDATTGIIRRYTTATYETVLDSSTGTIPANVTGLQNFLISNDGAAGSGNFVGTIDDVAFFNGVTTVDTTESILRTINLSDMTLDAWNFIRFNGVNNQFLKIAGSSGNSLVMAANELAVQLETDPPLTTLHGQFTINGTNENLPFNGGDPTSSVIDDPSTNSMTLVNTVTQNDPVPGAGVLWVETVDANNDGLFAKIKVAGAFQTVRII